MAEAPRIYLVSPPVLPEAGFDETLAGLLDAVEIACVRLALATHSEDAVLRAADALRAVCHARDVPLVLAEHYRLAARIGLDGAHLGDGARRVRAAREALGADAILGVHAGVSRHEGMTAAEIGADYVAFGPLVAGSLGDGVAADPELFAWWAEVIETPVVAEGGLTPALAAATPADFIALGPEVWDAPEGPLAALRAFAERLG